MSKGKRLTRSEIEQLLRKSLPETTKHMKAEIAECRANMASWFYRNSEPIPDESRPTQNT